MGPRRVNGWRKASEIEVEVTADVTILLDDDFRPIPGQAEMSDKVDR